MKNLKLIQIERSGSEQTAYWPTAVQPETTIPALEAEGTLIERPDLIDCISLSQPWRKKCKRVIQVKATTGCYAGTTGRFFAVL